MIECSSPGGVGGSWVALFALSAASALGVAVFTTGCSGGSLFRGANGRLEVRNQTPETPAPEAPRGELDAQPDTGSGDGSDAGGGDDGGSVPTTPVDTGFGGECNEGSTIVATVFAPTASYAPQFRSECPIQTKDPDTRTAPNCHIPDFDTDLRPVLKLCPDKIDVSARHFTEGFPDTEDPVTNDRLVEYFAVRYTATITVPGSQGSSARVRFAIVSDDGARVDIDGATVILNDGRHQPRRAESTVLDLTAGEHALRVDYFQGPRTQLAVQLFWSIDGGTEEIVPPAAFGKLVP